MGLVGGGFARASQSVKDAGAEVSEWNLVVYIAMKVSFSCPDGQAFPPKEGPCFSLLGLLVGIRGWRVRSAQCPHPFFCFADGPWEPEGLYPFGLQLPDPPKETFVSEIHGN